jgi:hypothetical protein
MFSRLMRKRAICSFCGTSVIPVVGVRSGLHD